MVASHAVDGSDVVLNADPRLQSYITKIWSAGNRAGSPVAVSWDRPPPGHVIAEQYAVLPHPRLTRFLVPLASHALAAASFREYNATRALVSRTIRGGMAAAFSSGLGGLVQRSRLVVSIDRRVPREHWADHLVTVFLAQQLGLDEVHAFVAVRQLNPNVKPTLQLFDRAAQPVGYAKLGTTEATRHLVRTEARAVAELSGSLSSVIVPSLLDAGDWGETAYAVTSPLPRDLRRWTKGLRETAEAGLAIARSSTTAHGPLAGSSYAARLRRDIDATDVSSEVAPALGRWLTRLEADDTPLTFGRMHGDWIPDNLGQSDSRLVAWDWEHSHPDTPLGFDLLHWHFHHALVRHDMVAAVAAVEQALPELALVHVPSNAHRLTGALYLLDIFIRKMKLATGGGGYNARWYPAMLDVARAHTMP